MRIKTFLLTLVMATGLIGLAMGLRGPYLRLAAEHWRKELAVASDDRVEGPLDKLAQLGEAGIPVLVESLGSPRECVVLSAHRLLFEQLNRWQQSGSRDSACKQAALAEALAEQAGRFDATARSDAAHLATQILLWLPEEKTLDRNRLIAACQAVLRATATGSYPAPSDAAVDVAGSVPINSLDHPAIGGMPLETLARMSGGGLPIVGLPGAAPPNLTKGTERQQPGYLVNTEAARPLPAGQESPGAGPTSHDPLRASDAEPARPVAPSPEPSAVKPSSAVEGSMNAAQPWQQAPTVDLSKIDTVELMRRLHATKEPTVVAAREELTRRGFTEVHIDLARRLFDPDTEVRKELARLLPDLHSIDAAPWLLWLARDKDAEVRLLAITLLATSSNPALLEQVEQMAQEDPDPRIQQRAERIAQQRNTKRR